ncbi:serine-threonine/tyrosine-protein kinase catalytic domain-containing protein, partial [Tanacetum coccineum]
MQTQTFNNDSRFIPLSMVKFLNDMEREKPIRFTSQQLRTATYNFTIELGSCGFGTVYKGIFTNGTLVAVKVKLVGPDGDHENEFDAPVDCYILDAANSAGVELPYSCQIAVNNKDKKETYATKVIDFDLVMQTTKAETHDSEACLNEG